MSKGVLLELLQEETLARLDKTSLALYADRYSSDGGTNRLLTDFAIFACDRFLSRDSSFWEVASALNCLMATAGWGRGEAPLAFWEVFTAFDDFDVSPDPEEDARPRIEQELARLRAV
jgi:hypothetical protein